MPSITRGRTALSYFIEDERRRQTREHSEAHKPVPKRKLFVPANTVWTPELTKKILKLWPITPKADHPKLAKRLGITTKQLSNKAAKYELVKTIVDDGPVIRSPLWTKDKLEILKRDYRKIRTATLSKQMGIPVRSINGMAVKLGLKKDLATIQLNSSAICTFQKYARNKCKQ
jgi:hypothetical protein